MATIFDLNGAWSSGGAPGPVITVSGNTLSVDMSIYNRPAAHGTIIDDSHISVSFPDDKTYTGTLSAPKTIAWSNNTSWTHFTIIDLNGAWIVAGVSGPVITVHGLGMIVDMSAYKRPSALGSVVDISDITVSFPDDRPYTGKLQSNDTILWSNNSIWTKAASLLAPPSILDIVNVVTADGVAQATTALHTLLNTMENGSTFPLHQASEWIQPFSPNTEYDDSIVAATGYAVNPRLVAGDFPFSHPFLNSIDNTQFDFEFSLALDRPPDTPSQFDYLLSLGNKAPTTNPDPTDERVKDETFATLGGLRFPLGLLGVEMNSGHIPRDFIQNLKPLDRVAVYGRWIVDTGHALATESGAKVQRTEIHPPLLTVAASETTPATTRAMFTSRPFLIGDTYTTDESKIYVDGASDDGTFLIHLAKELIKVNATILGIPTESLRVEAHPKIKSYPFRGGHLMHIVVRPPAQKAPPLLGRFIPQYLQVSYKFTVRSGCAVEVTSLSPDTVDILITMNSLAYKPPPLPKNTHRSWSRSELAALNSDAGGDYLLADVLSGVVQAYRGGGIGVATVEAILARGIKSDQYGSLNDTVSLLDRSGAATGTVSAGIPQTGVYLNDNQPYPVYGWLEAEWVTNIPVLTH